MDFKNQKEPKKDVDEKSDGSSEEGRIPKQHVALSIAQKHLNKIANLNNGAAVQEANLALSEIKEVLENPRQELYNLREREMREARRSQRPSA